MAVSLKSNYFSPLRYPGGKGKLSFYIQLLYDKNILHDGHYVEPYAGGASVALSLLLNEYAAQIHINDLDYRIYCFWQSVVNEPDRLCDMIDGAALNIKTWRLQKEVQRMPLSHSK